MEEIKRTIRCDMCGKEIEKASYPIMQLFMGNRYFVQPGILLGSKLKIDLCNKCVNTLKNIRRKEEGIGDTE